MNLVQVGDLPLGWVSESSPVTTPVAVLSVDDPDSGNNGDVTCDVINDFFRLEQLPSSSNYKLTVSRELNRETVASHAVRVTCRDDGSPALTATASLVVNVFDENDSNPVFR